MLDNKFTTSWLPRIVDIWVLVYMLGLLCSKALLAIGMVGLSLMALINYFGSKRTENFTRPYLYFLLIFLISLLSGLYSENLHVWLDFVLKKAPFLILPFVFISLKEHFGANYHRYMLWFVGLTAVFSVSVLANYLMHIDDMNLAISRGKALNTPIDHTEFSLYVAYAALISLFLYFDKANKARLGTQSTILLLSIFLIVFSHILAVRSGLAVLYLTFLCVGSWHLITLKKYRLILPLLIAICIVPFIAINTVPSLQKKLGYLKYDWKKFKKGEGVNYSDSERLYSLRAGWEVFKDNKLIGVGIGDLKDKCDEQYLIQPGHILHHYPHNQYLFSLAATGIIGLVGYLFALLGPYFELRKKLDPYSLILILVILSSSMVENTLERTFSIGFYLFFALTSISYLTSSWDISKSSYQSLEASVQE